MTEKLESRLLTIEKITPIKGDSEFIEALDKIIAEEQSKSISNMDSELISECVDIIFKVKKIDIATFEKRCEESTEKVLEKTNAIKSKKRKRQQGLIRFAAVFAVCIIIVGGVQIVSLSFNANFFVRVSEWGKQMYIALINNDINAEREDFIVVANESREYKNIEEFIRSENVNISVPKYMPDNLQITNIIYETTDRQRVSVIYNENTALVIYINENLIPVDCEEFAEIYIVNGTKHILYDETQQIDWIDDANTYRLIGDFEKNEFIKIIDSLY